MSEVDRGSIFPTRAYVVAVWLMLAGSLACVAIDIAGLVSGHAPRLLAGLNLIVYAISAGLMARRARYAWIEAHADPEFRSGWPRTNDIPIAALAAGFAIAVGASIGCLFLDEAIGTEVKPAGLWTAYAFLQLTGPILLMTIAMDWLSQRVKKRPLERTCWTFLGIALLGVTVGDINGGVFPYPLANYLFATVLIALQTAAPSWTLETGRAQLAELGWRAGLGHLHRKSGRERWAEALGEARVHFEPVE